MNKFTALLLALGMLAMPAMADNIYIWTDEKGVKRFSDQPPPVSVDTYETVEGAPAASGSQTRNDFEKMVEDVKQENRQAEIRREQEAAREKAEAERKAAEQKEARTAAERARLQQQIDQLNNRGLSPDIHERHARSPDQNDPGKNRRTGKRRLIPEQSTYPSISESPRRRPQNTS